MPSTSQKWTRHVLPWASACGQLAIRVWREGVKWTRFQAAESRKCSQCGKPVSLLDAVCPQCGGSSPAKISPLACAAVLAAGALLVTLVLWLI